MSAIKPKAAAAAVLAGCLLGAGAWWAVRTGARPGAGAEPTAGPAATPDAELRLLQRRWHVASVRIEVESHRDGPKELKTITFDRAKDKVPVAQFDGTKLNFTYLHVAAYDGWKELAGRFCAHGILPGLVAPFQFSVEVDPSKSPKQIDLIHFESRGDNLNGKGIYEFRPDGLMLAVGGERPAAFGGGPGVVEVRLTRFSPEETARADRKRELELAEHQASSAAYHARERRRLAEEKVELALREFTLASQSLRDAEAKLDAAKKAAAWAEEAPPAKDPDMFAVRVRTPYKPERVIRVKATGKETVLDGLSYAFEDLGAKPDAWDIWVLRDGAVLPVELAAAVTPKGELVTSSPLKAGDQLFLQGKLMK